jgi:ribose 5-phosphate isomerase A
MDGSSPAPPQAGDAEALKREAAIRAAEWIVDGMILGLGTGSTVRHLLDHVAARRRQGAWQALLAVATSRETEARARELGIPLTTLAAHPKVDLTIDGADEVDPELRLIKGLGGALLREKVVASVSRLLVIIVDRSKLVQRLGTRQPLPIEVDPFALPVLLPFFSGLGADPVVRTTGSGDPLRTDGGHFLVDCRFSDGISDPEHLNSVLNSRPGILETGLFLGMTDAVVVAGTGGVEVLSRPAPLA